MTRTSLILLISLLFSAPVAGAAKSHKGAAAPHQANKQTARAIDELQGKFKWGMTIDEIKKTLDDEIRKSYAEDWKKAVGNAEEQDRINREIKAATQKIEKSYIDFIGQKSSWEVSIIDREFAHGNQESMMVIQETQKKQSRFLFFYEGKLYKQFIAFDKDLFAGKDFGQFAQMIQNRYGRGVAKYTVNRKGEQVLQHLEWPPSGTTLLRAVDQSNFYDTFCLVIEDRNVSQVVAPRHKENAASQNVGASLVKDIESREKVTGDANSDIVDRITGRNKGASTNQEPSYLTNEPSKLNPQAGDTGAATTADPSEPAPSRAKPKKKNSGGKLDDLEL